MNAGQGFPPSMRKRHPTAMAGVDKVQLPNKPRLPRKYRDWLQRHGMSR